MNFKPIKYIHNGLYFEVHATLDNDKLGSLGHNIFHSDPGDGTEHIRLSKSEAEEYVSEIVRAVNSHDQLVVALEEIMRLSSMVHHPVDAEDLLDSAYDIAKAALKSVKQ
jgi:hypothetical protein